MGVGELVGWPAQISPRPRSMALSWLAPTSKPLMNCWSECRGKFYVSNAVGYHDTGQLQDICEEFRGGSSIYSVAAVRVLEPDQWLIKVSICKQRNVDKRVYSRTHVILYSFHNKSFSFYEGGEQVQRDQEMNGIGVDDMKSTNNQYKVKKEYFPFKFHISIYLL